MLSPVDMVLSCSTCPPCLRDVDRNMILAELELVPDDDMPLIDVLFEIGCEVVVEELVSRLCGGDAW